MPEWSPWRFVNRDWTIPEELLPANLWQLKWSCRWEFSAGASWGLNAETVKRKWAWQISDPGLLAIYKQPGATKDPIEAALFHSTVNISFSVVYLGVPGAYIYTWFPGNPSVYTDVPLKPPLLGGDPDAWVYDEATGEWHNATETVNIIPSSTTGDITNDVAILEFDAESWAYEIPLPVGARVSVPFHNIGAGYVLNRANFQIRTVRSSGCALRDPDQGVSWFCQGAGSGLAVTSRHDNAAVGPYAASVLGTGSPVSILRVPRTSGILAVTQRTGGLGASYSPADGQEGTWTSMATMLPGVTLKGACLSPDGGTIIVLGQIAGVLHTYRCDLLLPLHQRPPDPADGEEAQPWASVTDMGEAEVVVGGVLTPLPLSTVMWMGEQRGALHVLGTSGSTTVHYVSRDGGRSWQ